MLTSRFMRLATTFISTNEPTSTVVSNFITVRNQARADLIKNNQFNNMRLEPERDLLTYAKAIDKNSAQYCLKGNASYEAMANSHTKDEIVAMAVEVSNELEKHGEK